MKQIKYDCEIDFSDPKKPDLYTQDQIFAVSKKDKKFYPNSEKIKYVEHNPDNNNNNKIGITYDGEPKINEFSIGNSDPQLKNKETGKIMIIYQNTSKARDFIKTKFGLIGKLTPFYIFPNKKKQIPQSINELLTNQTNQKGSIMYLLNISTNSNIKQELPNAFMPVEISPQEDEFIQILNHNDEKIKDRPISFGYAQKPINYDDNNPNMILVKAKVFIYKYIPFLYSFQRDKLDKSLTVKDFFIDLDQLLLNKSAPEISYKLEVSLEWKADNKTKNIRLSPFNEESSLLSYLSLFDEHPIDKMSTNLTINVKIRN